MAKYAVFPDIENLDVLILGHFIAWLRSSGFLVLARYRKNPNIMFSQPSN